MKKSVIMKCGKEMQALNLEKIVHYHYNQSSANCIRECLVVSQQEDGNDITSFTSPFQVLKKSS